TPMYYEAVRDYKGPKLYYRLATAEYAKWFEDKIGVSTIPTCSGASVSNVTVDIARTWGCNPIILIGQDLGFTGKEVYADGAVLKEQWDKDINERIDQNKKELYNILTDIYGQPIYTDQAMLSIKVYFEEYVKSAKDIHLLNCTEGGVPIDGVENRSLREVIKQYCIKDYNIDEMLRDIYNKEISKSMSKADDVDKFLKELYNETLRMKELALKRIKLLYDTSKKGSIDKNAWRKIDKLTEEIEKMDSYKNLIGNVSQIFLQALKNENERSAEKTDSIKEKREILISGLLKQYGFVSDNVSYVNSILSKILM
ncbi:MAG: 6-hydroxymethylpterin diphosphokinase MptE-like protein, partial [Bacillota bacterium]